MFTAKQFQQILINYSLILLIAFVLFLILPLPFTKENSFCPRESCKGYEFETTVQHGWYWFGGYHTTIEGLFPMSSEELIDHAEKYDNIHNWQIGVLGGISIILAACSYTLVRLGMKKRRQ